MRNRTTLIASLCVFAALGHARIAAADIAPAQLYYDILDGDKLVGRLDISLESTAQGLIARQRGELAVKRMMLTAKIKQTVEERWQGKTLLSLNSETLSNVAVGESKKSLTVTREASGSLSAKSEQEAVELPSNALPMSIWSGRTITEGPHFDLGNGKLVELKANAASKANADAAQPVRYQDEDCRPSSFEAVNGSKRSDVTAWLGRDDIVCQLRISDGRDAFTYRRRPAP